MPISKEDTELYRRDVRAGGTTLSASEREALLQKYLPQPTKRPRSNSHSSTRSSERRTTTTTSTSSTTAGHKHKRRIRPYLKSKLYILLHFIVQFIFGIYMRLRQISNAVLHKFLTIRHYHHRTPAYIKKDTQSLSRLPDHLSILLRYDPENNDDGSALETLIDEVAELSAWTTAAGIPLLSVYESTGVLKSYMSAVQELVHQKLVQYFGPSPLTPKLRVYAPNLPILSPAPQSPLSRGGMMNGGELNGHHHQTPTPQLNLLLLSASDGRDTIVDLTRTLAEMSQSAKLRPRDINSSLINTEIEATTAVPTYEDSPFVLDGQSQSSAGGSKKTAPSEPDLLIIFGPVVKLYGYPPWQVRLSEIYCVGDSGGDVSRGVSGRTRVEYQAFLRALWNYSGAQMRFGR